MFSLFRSPPFSDPVLGTFERSHGRWRGRLVLAGRSLALAIAGTRGAPDANALAVAKLLPTVWSASSESVARALIEHLEPYRESVAVGEADPPSRPLPVITQPVDVWRFVELQAVSVAPLGGKLMSEVALAAIWDEEHTLGARFEGTTFVELNGSILAE